MDTDFVRVATNKINKTFISFLLCIYVFIRSIIIYMHNILKPFFLYSKNTSRDMYDPPVHTHTHVTLVVLHVPQRSCMYLCLCYIYLLRK